MKKSKSKTKSKSDKKMKMFFSAQFSGIPESKEKYKYSPTALISTVKCKVCRSTIVHETSPLEFLNDLSSPAAVKVTSSQQSSSVKKKESLQRMLSKSQESKPVLKKDELDLESFLHGFL